MRTSFRIKQPYSDIFLSCANEYQVKTPVFPKQFIKKMKNNRGSIGILSGLGKGEDGLERKNPLIVALGDSVTAGHFESLMLQMDPIQVQNMFINGANGTFSENGNPALEITDARECYLEKFRVKLIDKYEQTSVSTINSGISGDDIFQMAERADRDVIRYQPDLVIINGSLNWNPSYGEANIYKNVLRGVIKNIKDHTEADIVLLTPNGDLPNPLLGGIDSTTPERVKVIRELAVEEQVCLVDVYEIWEQAREKGCPWEELLANGLNHPGVEGHEVYAEALMKLFV